MNSRLYERICQFNAKTRARFCMPAHSGDGDGGAIYSCAQYDWTEVYGLDNLLSCDDIILKTQQSIAQSMGYEYALMLTHGSTCGMHIAVCVCKEKGKTLVAVGDMHKSFYAARRLYGVDVIRVKSDDELQTLTKDMNIGGIFVTSPDYFGVCAKLCGLRKTADRLGAYLVVDEAHGAHFAYSSLLPENAREYADISLMSMHKTLPVYGGGALVCVNTLPLKLKCEEYRSLIHSSSPNYLTMASMDYANEYMKTNGEKEYARVKKAIDGFTKKLRVGKVVKNDDFTRLVVKVDGKDADKALSELAKRGIYGEMAKDDLLVFIVTPFNCAKLGLLAEELNSLTYENLDAGDCLNTFREIEESEILNCAKDIATKESGEVEFVDVESCLGRVCAADIGVYPPGAPFIISGEIICESHIKLLKKYRNRLFGLASGLVAVIK